MNAFIASTARKKAKAATRARILETARAQLEELGFEGTSIRSVATAAGVATGTVLLHFPDKRDLLHATVFDDLELTWRRVKAKARAGGKTLRQELVGIAKAFFDYYARRPALSLSLIHI